MGSPPPRRVALAAGGTAGHVNVALAVAEEWRRREPVPELVFFGSLAGPEGRLASASGIEIERLDVSPVLRRGAFEAIRGLGRLLRAVARTRRLLRGRRIDLVVGFGRYESAAPMIAALTLGVPTALHEANATPGVTNRWLGRWVDRAYLGSEAVRAAFPASKSLVTGIPLRAAILRAAERARTPPAAHGAPYRVAVLGGSLGSTFLNERAPSALAALSDLALEVRHQSGAADAGAARRAYEDAGLPAKVEPYWDDVAVVYDWADVAVTSAGATTLAELAALGLPAIVVPLPEAAGGHQRDNARSFAASAGCPWVDEATWKDVEVADRLRSLLTDEGLWRKTAARMRRSADLEAAARLVNDCNERFASTGVR